MARRWLRRRWAAVVPLALLVSVGTAGTVVALTAAERTARAYDGYLVRAEVGDVVINPSLSTEEIAEVVRSLPGVERATSSVMFVVSNDDGAPRPRREIEADDAKIRRQAPGGGPGAYEELDAEVSGAVVLGSTDGRFVDMDRPVVQAGRMATGSDEMVITTEAAERTGLGLGDVLPLAVWSSALPAPGQDVEAFMDEVVSPLGVEHVEVVGIVTLPDEVLPDGVFPRARMILSPDVVARYDCLPPTPPPGLPLAELLDRLGPPDCASTYRYFSLDLAAGEAGVKPALAAFLAAVGAMNADLADVADRVEPAPGYDAVPQYYLIPTETERERRHVARAVGPTVTALRALAGAAGVTTVVLVGLLVARDLRRAEQDLQQLQELGVGSRERAGLVGLPLLLAVLAGGGSGFGVGWWFDPGPVGLVGVLDPVLGRELVGRVPAAAGVLTAVLALSVVVLAARAVRRPGAGRRSEPRGSWASGVVARLEWPATASGLRAAYGQRAAGPVVASGAILAAALVAAMVFGSSLSALLATPRSYGWPWDAAAMVGAGYGGVDVEAVEERFGSDPDVDGWTALGLLNEVTLNGEPVMTVVGLDRSSDVDLPLLRGSLPRTADEVALGARSAASLGVDVGDVVELGGVFDPPRSATVTGMVVFPTLGPLMAERVGTGTGLLLSEMAVEELGGQYQDATAHDLATFVGLDLAGSPVSPEVRERTLAQIAEMQRDPYVWSYPAPVRPPEIIDAGSTRAVPGVVSVVLAAVILVGLGSVVWASARGRRRELATLQVLGFDGGQVRWSIRVQSVATMAGALAGGVPAGILVGRALWRTFAEQLGVVPEPTVPGRIVVVVVLVGLLLAAAAASVPARLAGRQRPAEGLRTE